MRLPLGIGLILLWWAAGSAGQPAVGAEPAREPEPAIRWRRIYAPADRLKEWPFGPLRYVPVEAVEFEQLWSAARIMTSASAPVPLAARITTARYQARLVDDQFVEGEAFLEVVHGGKTPLLLPLDPCGLTIGKARWLDPADAARGGGKGKPAPRGTKSPGPAATPIAAVGPEKAGNFREAVIGLRPDGKLALLVERSGVLWWQWSLRGRRNTAGTIHFPFQLPACLTNRLIVDLPERQRPKADHEMVEDLGPAGTGYRRWQVECGGHSHVEVRVTATAAAEEPSQLTVLRQSSLYDFSLRGIDVSAQWTLDVRDQPLRQLVVALDPELQLVSARLGNRPLPWSATAAPGHGANLTVLEMPEPIQGTGQTLRLAALAPLPSLSVGRSWRLPRIRLEGAFWQQGSATLLVPFPLLVEQFFPDGCRQSGTAPLPSPRLGESMQFECFSPDASLAIVLTHGQPKIQLNSATTLEWGNGEIKGRVVGDFQVIDGETFSLKAEVNKPWIVDSVESIPRDAMDDWNVDESGGRSRLGIILAKALSPSRPIRLQITARRLYFQLDPQLGFDEPAPGKRLHGAEAHAPLPGRNQRFA
jgi:hypothetical protein